jgi:hypothetical protein
MNWVLVSPDVSRKSRNNKRVENATLFRFGPEFDSRQLHQNYFYLFRPLSKGVDVNKLGVLSLLFVSF